MPALAGVGLAIPPRRPADAFPQDEEADEVLTLAR
jgi:hypothetical protein